MGGTPPSLNPKALAADAITGTPVLYISMTFCESWILLLCIAQWWTNSFNIRTRPVRTTEDVVSLLLVCEVEY